MRYLSAKDCKSYRDNGFLRCRATYDSVELEVIRKEVARVTAQASNLPAGTAWLSPSTSKGIVVQRISRINCQSRVIQEWGASDRRLLSIAIALLDSPRVRFADGSEGSDGVVLVAKDPENASEHRELRWHRDADFTGHLPINPFVNIGIYLDDAPAGAGNLVIVPRSQRLNVFDERLAETTEIHPHENSVVALAGDVVAHDSGVWHCSRAHLIPGLIRRVLYFNFYRI